MLWRLLQWQLRETEKDSRATLMRSLFEEAIARCRLNDGRAGNVNAQLWGSAKRSRGPKDASGAD